ncbi:hypothetical protein HYR99_13090 [Candidatus Poribacteria bacterium]|nr:hypothetical protein [Candidatus Poribacteria bacterium]
MGCHQPLSDGFIANEGDMPRVARFTALFAIVANNPRLSLTTFKRMRLGVNVNNNQGFFRASSVLDKEVVIDVISRANMPCVKSVQRVMSGRWLAKSW